MMVLHKLTAIFIIMILIAMSISFVALAEENPTVFIDGEELIFTDVKPVIINNRTMVPMRAVFERLGFVVSWDPVSQAIFANNSSKGKFVIMNIGRARFMVNENRFDSDVPPMLYNSRTLIPLRALTESLGATVNWNGEKLVVDIKTKK